MGLFGKLFNKSNDKINLNIIFNSNDNFNPEEYSRYNEEKINEFKSKYDLTTIEGIKLIPIIPPSNKITKATAASDNILGISSDNYAAGDTASIYTV